MHRSFSRRSSLSQEAGLVSVVALVAAAIAGGPSAPLNEQQSPVAEVGIAARVNEARERVQSILPAAEEPAYRTMRMAQWRNV